MLVMTLLVKNERDIIEANLKFHLERGVDHIIVTDNGSDDGTRDTIAEYAKFAPLTVIDEPGDDYSQHRWVTRMALMAAREMGADWIINNDADEFWESGAVSLSEALESANADLVMCGRRNMVFPYDAENAFEAWYQRLVYRAVAPERPAPVDDPLTSPLDRPHFMRALPGKAALRSEGLEAVDQGNHGARYDRPIATGAGPIDIYHYPVRSRAQFELKIRQGGAAYARNKDLPVAIGWHWRRWLAKIEREGVDAALAEALPSVAMVQAQLADGTMMRDEVMVQKLERLSHR